jgi:hypothetical protein
VPLLAAHNAEDDAVAANFVRVVVLTLVAGPTSAHDHPGVADVAHLAETVAFLERVLSVHEIASCHFDLGSFDEGSLPLVDGTAAILREMDFERFLKLASRTSSLLMMGRVCAPSRSR